MCTQGTYEFLQHVPELCQRWEGPLSVSVYAPGTDLPVAVRKIIFLRSCGPPCVRLNVTWHLIFETALGPPVLETPHTMAEMEDYEPLDCELGTKALNLVSEIRNVSLFGRTFNNNVYIFKYLMMVKKFHLRNAVAIL